MKHFYTFLIVLSCFNFGFGQEPPNEEGDLTYMTLNMSSSTNSYSTDVYFNDNASLGFDFGFDAEFFGTPPAFALYTLLVEDNEGNAITLQAINTMDLGDTTISLGVNANQGEELTFSISTLELPATTEVYLEDNVESTSTLLTQSNYVITPSTNLSGTGRFFLRFFDPNFLSLPENTFENLEIVALNASNEIIVNGQLMDNSIIEIFNIEGKLVHSAVINSSANSNRIDVSSLNAGVYIAQLRSNGQQKSKKVIIN